MSTGGTGRSGRMSRRGFLAAGSAATVALGDATWRETVLSDRKSGHWVNVEVDILARYVAKMLGGKGIEERKIDRRPGALTKERLQGLGY